jgi:hypothetical protein
MGDRGENSADGDAAGQSRAKLRASLLQEGQERDHCYEHHTLITNKVRLPTPSVRAAYELVSQAVVHRETGLVLVADFRIGKTTALEVISILIQDVYPNLAIGAVIAKAHHRPSDAKFFGDLLFSFGHSAWKHGTASVKNFRLIEAMRAQAHRSGGDRYLLFVDEGQNWGESELTHLRDLANELRSAGISLITVFFAHPLLLDTRSELLNKRRTDLVGRFLRRFYYFHGVRTCDELREILTMHDDPSVAEYPAGSGISYTEFFMPRAWLGGWRMAHEAQALFNAFTGAGVNGGAVAEGPEFAMEWVSGAIRNFLLSQAESDSVDFSPAKSAWDDAVLSSGYASVLR